ncbi:chaperone [Lithospermum erythrorhizon]|uniref:Chaperone n=1 Tax=Lithospermum erythrorhizon TaxID=34254 RepID=A0AAV3R7L4_LITER
MAGASVGQSLHGPCSGRKTLRKCQENAATDNVVFIDVDGGDLENVIVIDSPKLFSKKLRGLSKSKDKKNQRRVVICIDDEESTDNEQPDIGVKKRCNFSSSASSNKGPSAAAENHDKFRKEVSDDCESVQEIISSPVTISKCKRTYSGKAPSRNCYGLGPESDDFSNDEFLDCDLVEEDFFGSVREQWEKAFSKRKYENRNGQTGVVGCSKTSKAPRKSTSCGEKVASEQPNEPTDFCSSEKASCETAGPSPTPALWKIPKFTIFTTKRRSLAVPVSKSVLKEHAPYKEANSDCGSNPLAENASMECCEDPYDHNLKCDGGNFPNVEPEESSFNLRHSAVEVDPVTDTSQLRAKSETMKEDSSRSPQVHQEQAPEGSAAKQLKESLAFSISSNLGSAESCMISDREKLKETDEYKKAVEEEWASRRQALQIQAEEAKQLRLLQKRKNAEHMRLLDMERRQKQRVEEIRENMKNDEEQMNMKDLIRVEVRNELSKVEITCCDMASLLRSLGIQVGSQLRPNTDEVRAACKRALFAFHPDRASKSNTRQQVEAEEKFKLISRMKEKFSMA